MHIPRIFYEAIAFLYLVDVETKFARVLFHDLNCLFQIFQVPFNTAKAKQKKKTLLLTTRQRLTPIQRKKGEK